MATVGDVLNGRFRLDHQLGRGGFAEVFLATDLLLSSARLQRRVAVKVLDPRLIAQSGERDFLARFRDEASVIAALDHPHILGLYDYGEMAGTAYLVMPYVGGGTLHDRLSREGRLAPPLAANYLRQAAAALDYAHDLGLVHRDIKPQNLLLREGGEHLYLADFGIAKLLSGASAHSHTGVLGTIAYMPPEQFQGRVGRPTDIYALGVVLFELLTGGVPYDGPTEQILYGHMMAPIPSVVERSGGRVPAELQPVIERALAKRPEDRYPRAGDFARAFVAALDAPTAVPPPAPAHWPHYSGPHPFVAEERPPITPAPGSTTGRPPQPRGAPLWLGSSGLVLVVLAWSFLAGSAIVGPLHLSSTTAMLIVVLCPLLAFLFVGMAAAGASRGNRWPFVLTLVAIPLQALHGSRGSVAVLLVSIVWVVTFVSIGLRRERRR